MRTEHMIDYGDASPGLIRGQNNPRVEGFREVRSGTRRKRLIIWALGVVLVLGMIGMIVGLLLVILRSGRTHTSSTSDAHSSATFNWWSTSTSTGPVTNTLPCPTGYTRSPFGTCANLVTDFFNCGWFGFVCPPIYTYCSAGVCSGASVFSNISLIIWDDSSSIDDAIQSISLPVNITLYGYTTNTISLSINGVLCLDTCSPSYVNRELPTTDFGGPVAFGYWSDLMIYIGTNQSVFYTVSGFAPNRTTVVEFNTANSGQSTEQYHFQIIFEENRPGIITYHYLLISDNGISGTIGVQASSLGPAMNYSVNQANSVSNNLVLTFDTDTGTFVG